MNHSKHILLHADFRAMSSVPPETALSGANGEIKDTITAGKFRANSLTTLAIQTVGTVGTLVDRSAPIGVSQLHTMPLDFRI